jgi:D-serine deaminase-like pyridoxal phosphate-dependent protein
LTREELFEGVRSAIGKTVFDIETPALVVDLDIMEANMDKMMQFLKKGSVGIRPHAKTHKTPQIALEQIEKGALGICCAKVGEAEAMVDGGVGDILITSQIVGSDKIKRVARLSTRIDLKVAVDSVENVRDLSAAAQCVGGNIGIVIECEVGNNRCGIRRVEDALEIARLTSTLPGLRFCGIMGYEGHCVFMPDLEQRKTAANKAYDRLLSIKDLLLRDGFECEIVSTGGTGTYLFAGCRNGITDIEAGSYIFMDGRYGSTPGIDFKQSLTVISSIVSHPTEDLWVCDAGLKSMTREFGLVSLPPGYGLKVLHMSEEHTKLVPTDEACCTTISSELSRKYVNQSLKSLKVGDKVFLVPSHCCTTVNLHDVLYAVRGGIVEDIWAITGRGRFD